MAATTAGQTSLTPETKKNRIIRFYQTFVSGADGNRCPMYPSCSEYAARALKKHGPVMGWIMTCDRLMRCGRSDARLAPEIRIQDRPRIYDPVSANDFWWFTPPPDGS
jgi:putative membrane protein insertion efficiency factor